ncbi:hypothetical protein IWW36_001774 [Coemansia brasiliensis]|uniref:Uncharacterized protein n=1 Tax=Coemansia brasiliensis TaxID=2650707 RepID=A0A9W8M189_9FUNG|nr:hypothetical protein IWW36_001774 [Coemansia brasiliensis]
MADNTPWFYSRYTVKIYDNGGEEKLLEEFALADESDDGTLATLQIHGHLADQEAGNYSVEFKDPLSVVVVHKDH